MVSASLESTKAWDLWCFQRYSRLDLHQGLQYSRHIQETPCRRPSMSIRWRLLRPETLPERIPRVIGSPPTSSWLLVDIPRVQSKELSSRRGSPEAIPDVLGSHWGWRPRYLWDHVRI